MGVIDDFFEKFPAYDAIVSRDEIVVKSALQVNSATDDIGTFDGSNFDIQYSLDEDYDFSDTSKLDEKYGYENCQGENYCPITIDDDTVYGTYADVLINRSINSRAFLHVREKFKYNRLKLKGAIGKLQSQIDSVSSWCGLTMPIENFNRVYNMTRFEHEDDDLIRSVQNENLIAVKSVRQKNNTPEGVNKGNGRKSIKDIINRSISSISKTLKFNVKEEFKVETKPELALEDYFKKIGGSVYR